MRLAIDGHLPFLHGLEQRALRFGGRAVDLVGEQERREDRSAHQLEGVVLEVEDIGAGDVGGHQVRGELDAVEVRAEDVRERAHEEGFGHAGHALDERVLAGEDGDERFIDHVLLADDDFGHFGAGGRQEALELIEVFHARTC